jgi:hypothetical protein
MSALVLFRAVNGSTFDSPVKKMEALCYGHIAMESWKLRHVWSHENGALESFKQRHRANEMTLEIHEKKN